MHQICEVWVELREHTVLFQQHAVQTSDYLVERFPSHSCFRDEDFLLLRSIDQRQAPPTPTPTPSDHACFCSVNMCSGSAS